MPYFNAFSFIFYLFLKTSQPVNYIPTITNYTQLWWVPNVVVAHQKEGIEAVHLASGRTVCKVNIDIKLSNSIYCNHILVTNISPALFILRFNIFYKQGAFIVFCLVIVYVFMQFKLCFLESVLVRAYKFHLFSQLHLQEGGLHADINGDGVLDHVQVHFISSLIYSSTTLLTSISMGLS